MPDLFVQQFEAAAEEHGLPPVVCLYNEGNVLNNRELPVAQLRKIISRLADSDVKRLVLESRPEYVTDAVLGSIRESAGPMEIEIGVGLESSNDFIRNEIFLKDLSLKAYERVVRRMRVHGIRSLAYVILKPPFLNEAQSIADTVATARYAFGVGTDVVSLEPIGVEPFTISELMYSLGHFRPAWLWSVIRVTRAIHSLGEVRIGGLQFDPPPTHVPTNCTGCTARVLASIDRYNLTYNVSELDGVTCDCESTYWAELSSLSPSIDEPMLRTSLESFAKVVSGNGAPLEVEGKQ